MTTPTPEFPPLQSPGVMGDEPVPSALRSSPTPRKAEDILPAELWTIILELCLYTHADFSPSLQWEDVAGVEVDVEEEQELFKECYFLVSRQFYVTAFCLVSRYLVLTSQDDIEEAREVIARGTGISTDDVGAWTWRVDLRIPGRYMPSLLTGLFKLIPNLRVLVIRNPSLGRSSADRFRPDAIVQALGTSCRRLTRLQFESVGEEPTVRMLKDLLRTLPKLETLHLDSAYTPAQGPDDNEEPISTQHQSLVTLSIGSVRRRYHTVTGLNRAGVFLSACIVNHALPKLRVVHLQKAVPFIAPFMEEYGNQLKEVGYGSGELAFAEGYDWEDPESWHPHISTYCPNLANLVLITTEWPIHAPVRDLASHTAVNEIDIVYVRPEGATGGGRGAVLGALRVIERTELPRLKTITIATSVYVAAIEAIEGWFNALRETRERGITVNMIVVE